MITVRTKKGQLLGQATGQTEFEVFAESKDTFFLMVVAAKLVFSRDESGKVDSLTLFQNGQELKGTKKD
ncbi:MAG: DUF3471 domain-containing protein [Maribacter sp.]